MVNAFALPCPALPCPALPCPALPCPALHLAASGFCCTSHLPVGCELTPAAVCLIIISAMIQADCCGVASMLPY